MLGIRNADGAISWVMDTGPGARATVRLSPVRHGQKRVRVQFFLGERGSIGKRIGELGFATKLGGFLEQPEFETTLRMDSQGKLYVSIDVQGRAVHKRFVLPGTRTSRLAFVPSPVTAQPDPEPDRESTHLEPIRLGHGGQNPISLVLAIAFLAIGTMCFVGAVLIATGVVFA